MNKRLKLLAPLAALTLLLGGCGLTDLGGSENSAATAAAAPETTAAETTAATANNTTTTTSAAATTTTAAATAAPAETTATSAATATAKTTTTEKPETFTFLPDLTPTVDVRSPLILSEKDAGSYPKIETNNYYYSALDENRRKIYEAIYDVIMHTNDAGYKTQMKMPYDVLWDFSDDFYFIYYCVMDDYPEFYHYDENINVLWEYGDPKQDQNGDYLINVYQTEKLPAFWTELRELDAAAEEFLADIDLSGSEYDIALRVHDKLIGLVKYDDDNDALRNNIAYGQTVYGALISNGHMANGAVCEGYSDAYSYLLRRLGILCMPIEGSVGTGETLDEAEEAAAPTYHTWNLLRLDGKWYEVDATWDDYNTEDNSEYVKSLINAKAGLVEKTKHYYWARSTAQMENLHDWDSYVYFTDSEGTEYATVHKYATHIRSSDTRAAYNHDYPSYARMSSLLPEAK